MSNAYARFASALPMEPSPMMPILRSVSSSSFCRTEPTHLCCGCAWTLSTMPRVMARIIAMALSATLAAWVPRAPVRITGPSFSSGIARK